MFDSRLDEELCRDLDQADVVWNPLAESARAGLEAAWRQVYGPEFQVRTRRRRGAGRARSRFKEGTKADHEYQSQECRHYVIIPFSSPVPGLTGYTRGSSIGAYECRGPLVPLGAFCAAEFFVVPPDLSWSMVHTHEDHALCGPFFLRLEWLS